MPYSFGGQGVLDSGSPLRVFVKIPDRVTLIIEALITVSFRQFFASAKDAASGGGSTGGASSASSSGASSAASSEDVGHAHTIAAVSGTTGGKTLRQFTGPSGEFDLPTNFSGIWYSDTEGAGAGHHHGIAVSPQL